MLQSISSVVFWGSIVGGARRSIYLLCLFLVKCRFSTFFQFASSSIARPCAFTWLCLARNTVPDRRQPSRANWSGDRGHSPLEDSESERFLFSIRPPSMKHVHWADILLTLTAYASITFMLLVITMSTVSLQPL